MNLILKRFSQDVDLSNPDEVRYFLVFEAPTGEIRLPVQQETTQELIKLLYAAAPAEPEPEEVEETDATEFGGDSEEEEEEVLEGPDSEEAVPSI